MANTLLAGLGGADERVRPYMVCGETLFVRAR
jgi:hypothetical protein